MGHPLITPDTLHLRLNPCARGTSPKMETPGLSIFVTLNLRCFGHAPARGARPLGDAGGMETTIVELFSTTHNTTPVAHLGTEDLNSLCSLFSRSQ
jgi:hypothetical protein